MVWLLWPDQWKWGIKNCVSSRKCVKYDTLFSLAAAFVKDARSPSLCSLCLYCFLTLSVPGSLSLSYFLSCSNPPVLSLSFSRSLGSILCSSDPSPPLTLLFLTSPPALI